jgi:hypothetical protein
MCSLEGEASEKLVVARIVEIIQKVVTVIKMGKETIKTFTELAVNHFPTVVKDPIRGWTPISEDYFRMNEEVYQSKWLIVVPASRIKSIAMVKKNDVLIGESAEIFGMKILMFFGSVMRSCLMTGMNMSAPTTVYHILRPIQD